MKDVREVADRARNRLGERGQGTILFLDEVHRFSRAQQDVLLPFVEEGLLVLIGATTENPFFSLTGPLLSRSTLFRLEPLDDERAHDARAPRARRPGARTRRPNPRRSTTTRSSISSTRARATRVISSRCSKSRTRSRCRTTAPQIALDDTEAALAMRNVRYGDDEHYDIISAFIKSIRGSDPDAGLYWLARMLEAGEDARFIARRLVILASEDIGLADPNAILVAEAAARAVEYVGLPEAAINLAHAVLHLSLAPKSNSVITALGAATAAVRDRRTEPVPIHLRDAHYRGAQLLGHGEGYVYPHDAPTGWVPQEHLPVEVAGERFYRPGRHGAEPELYRHLQARRGEDDRRCRRVTCWRSWPPRS